MSPSRRWTCQSSGRRMVRDSVIALPLWPAAAYLSPMPATRLFDRAVVRVSPPAEARTPPTSCRGCVTNDVTGAAAGLGRAADRAGQGAVRLHRLARRRRASCCSIARPTRPTSWSSGCRSTACAARSRSRATTALGGPLAAARRRRRRARPAPRRARPALARAGRRDDEPADDAWLAHRLRARRARRPRRTGRRAVARMPTPPN